jgi:hypothetical protein
MDGYLHLIIIGGGFNQEMLAEYALDIVAP